MRRPLAVMVLAAAAASAAEAAPASPPAATTPPPPALSSPADLDGVYLTVGPIGAAALVEDEWLGAAGLEVSLLRVRERRVPAAIGLAAGGVSFSGREGGRLWAELETALDRPLPVAIGVGAGITAEVDRTRPPRLGWQATAWVFAGVVPYARIGSVEEAGSFVEAGVMIKLPVGPFR